jgi:4-hydroxy-tetrahydrodipicolinate reductase
MSTVAILGVTGRMGRALLHALGEQRELRLAGALASPASASLGQDVGELAGGRRLGVTVTSSVGEALAGAEVAIDFTVHAAVGDHVAACVKNKRALVIGTTGLPEAALAQLRAAAQGIPVLMSPNMSVGVNLLCRLAQIAARTLGEEFDAEIVEMHHRHKLDAPSGTALRIGESVAAARGTTLAQAAVSDRQGARRRGQIGFASLRGGDVVGEHTLLLAGNGESLALTHRATDRLTFARGALRAAQWLLRQPPGLYGMDDVIGFKSNA